MFLALNLIITHSYVLRKNIKKQFLGVSINRVVFSVLVFYIVTWMKFGSQRIGQLLLAQTYTNLSRPFENQLYHNTHIASTWATIGLRPTNEYELHTLHSQIQIARTEIVRFTSINLHPQNYPVTSFLVGLTLFSLYSLLCCYGSTSNIQCWS